MSVRTWTERDIGARACVCVRQAIELTGNGRTNTIRTRDFARPARRTEELKVRKDATPDLKFDKAGSNDNSAIDHATALAFESSEPRWKLQFIDDEVAILIHGKHQLHRPPPRLARLLMLLALAYDAALQLGRDPRTRGWQTSRQLHAALEAMRVFVERSTVTHMAGELRRYLTVAFGEDGAGLVEIARMCGARVTERVEVIGRPCVNVSSDK